MKTRIVIYVCLFLLLGVGIFYITQRQQTPTGMATGSTEFVIREGKITEIRTDYSAKYVKFYLESDSSRYEFYCYAGLYGYKDNHDIHIQLAMLAFQTQCDCTVTGYQWGGGFHEVYNIILKNSDTINDDLMNEIKKVKSGIDYVKRWLYWIWRYVYYTYRRVR